MSPRLVFNGVDVGLPSKVRGSEAEEEWQEVDWVSWSTGELAVDGDSFLLVFKPSGGGTSVKAKPLGSLVRASGVSASSEDRTFVVTTSDPLHRLLRFTFPSGESAADFARLAASAEAAVAAASGSQDAGQGGEGGGSAEADARLEASVREKLAGRWPLVFTGVDLYGPGPNAQAGDEVLIGHGALALLDPPEDCKSVGAYELLFFGEDEASLEPTKRFPIGPRVTIAKQAQEEDDEAAASYTLASGVPGVPAHTITFESANVASAFARDFRVRQRLMEMSMKTVKRGHAAEALRGEIEGLKRQTLSARLQRFLCLCIVLLTIAAMARVAMLYAKDKGARPPAEYFKELGTDARQLLQLSRSAVAAAGAKACEAAFGAVPAEDVRRCAALADGSKQVGRVARCLEALVGPV